MNALCRIGRPRPARSGASQAAESVHGALSQAHAGELDRWASRLGEAVAEGFTLGVRLIKPRLELTPMPRQHHDVRHGKEEEGNRCHGCQVTRKCFHERLPSTTSG